MIGLADYVKRLAAPTRAVVSVRDHVANYPFPGSDTFGFLYIEEVPGFDPAGEFPGGRGAANGPRLFKVVLHEVRRPNGINGRLPAPRPRPRPARPRCAGPVRHVAVLR